jgi:hypothetical protein
MYSIFIILFLFNYVCMYIYICMENPFILDTKEKLQLHFTPSLAATYVYINRYVCIYICIDMYLYLQYIYVIYMYL